MMTIARILAWIIGSITIISGKHWILIFKFFLKLIGSFKASIGQVQIFTGTSMTFEDVINWAGNNKLPCIMQSDQGPVFLIHGTPESFMVGLERPITVDWNDIGKWVSSSTRAYWLFSCGAGFRNHSIWSNGMLFRNIPATEMGGVAALSPAKNGGLAIWASTVYDCLVTAPQVLAALIKREITVGQYLRTMWFYVK